jgi:hypothetical protein
LEIDLNIEAVKETVPTHFPDKTSSPFTIGDIMTIDVDGHLDFHCTLYWNGREVAKIDSSPGPFEPLNWEWLDKSAKDDFASFLRLVKFPTADLFVGSMIACFCNIEWLAKECETDTLFRFATDPPHVFQRVKQPFSPELKARLIKRYGKNIYFFNEALDRYYGIGNILD